LGFARARTRALLTAALLLILSGCPQQELAPIAPCTVSLVSISASQTGTDQVDLVFVIDSSGSMSEEQVKLNAQLPRLVQALTSGDLDGVPNADGQPDFHPVGSLRLGVVSVDLGANGVTGVRSCGSNSYDLTAMDVNAQGADSIDRPFGDDGLLLNSTAVAVSGVWAPGALGGLLGAMPTQSIAPRPECALTLPRVLEYPTGGTPQQIAAEFSCMAELGSNGCSVEQQLESMWKAFAPSTDHSFSRGSGGQGLPAGLNAGFLRPEAILAVILVSDEEDCSSPDSSAQAIYGSLDLLQINAQCASNAAALHPVARYINGLKSLKADAFKDRIIFGGIVGVPRANVTRGLSLDQILALREMQVNVIGGTQRPSCTATGGAGTATPARRMVQVAQAFGEDGIITSICEDDYGAALDAIIAKIAGKLSGECLPRRLFRDANGRVDCRVVEIKPLGDRTPCDLARGRFQQLPDRTFEGTTRMVCEIAQLSVVGNRAPAGIGWYYDDFSNLVSRCQENPQRIAFSEAAAINIGAAARFECFRPVSAEQSDTTARGLDAVNTPCGTTPTAAATTMTMTPRGLPVAPTTGDGKCRALSTPDAPLRCVYGTCQLECKTDADCKTAANTCAATEQGVGYCVNPTCPLN
jgi:hypothetical protein